MAKTRVLIIDDSALVRSLIQPSETAWLIHPPEVTTTLRQELELESGGEPA